MLVYLLEKEQEEMVNCQVTESYCLFGLNLLSSSSMEFVTFYPLRLRVRLLAKFFSRIEEIPWTTGLAVGVHCGQLIINTSNERNRKKTCKERWEAASGSSRLDIGSLPCFTLASSKGNPYSVRLGRSFTVYQVLVQKDTHMTSSTPLY